MFQLAFLPPPQRRFWDELGATPRDFVLYGGTALALRLGHRQSEDFGFCPFAKFRRGSPDAGTAPPGGTM